MSFDDPLAGILSDGSDDSFFDDDILGKKKTPKNKNILPNAQKKNTLFNLEDDQRNKAKSIETKKSSSIGVDEKDSNELKLNPTSPGPRKKTVLKDSFKLQKTDANKSPIRTRGSTSADDKLNYLHEPNKETEKRLEKSKSSQLLLDDILGDPPKKLVSNQTQPVTAAATDFDLDSFLEKETSKPVQKKSVLQKKNTRKEDVPSSKKKTSDDWLGLFKDKIDDHEDNIEMPLWLGGDSKKETEKRSDKKKPTEQEQVKKNEPKEVDKVQSETEKQSEPVKNVEEVKKLVTLPSSTTLQETTIDITTEGAAMYFQQQEAQLMVAMQLKAQEEKLAAMQLRQKEIQRVQREAALAHHSQLDAMLKKQMENRHQMQAIIAAHQERITQRIKALLSTGDGVADVINNMTEEYDNPAEEQKETPYSRERKQLLQLVRSLQENHDKEIDLMETSYRRQLAFLEVSLNQSEERMKEESDKLVRFYTEKIKWLEEHHQLYKKMTIENLDALTERHKSENEMLRQQHLENIKILQEHHATLMENIKNTVKQEQVLMQDAAGFSKDLHELVSDVKENKSQCQTLVNKVQALVKDTQDDVKTNLEIREAQIKDMTQQLKKERENFETEKTENRELVKMLETRLKQMTTMIEEETVSLKQKRMEFEFEKATFNKETEFAKNTMNKQEEEIKMLKEDIQKEYHDKMVKIDEERNRALKENATIAKEKAAVLTLKQDLEKMKAELQARLEQVNEEKAKLNVDKQQMDMEEQRILAKSRNLDMLTKSAVDKQEQADKKYSEAEFLQKKCEEGIRRMQEHIVSLNSREKQIAREKVVLSRERLALHNERKQIESRQKCSLCKSTSNIPYNYEAGFAIPDSFNTPASRDVNNIPVNSAMNAIEQEMAHLMGRNFSLRHNVGVGNANEYDNRKYLKNEDEFIPNMMNNVQINPESFKDYRDPKFMMLRLDVQKVLNNIEQSRSDVQRSEHLDSDQ